MTKQDVEELLEELGAGDVQVLSVDPGGPGRHPDVCLRGSLTDAQVSKLATRFSCTVRFPHRRNG
jgi:hypothetical protein